MNTSHRITRVAFTGALSTLFIALACGQANAAPAAPPSFPCGGFGTGNAVKLIPVPRLSNGEFTNPGADCAMWQTFFYLNWPAVAGKRGVPDTNAKFGAPGATVWETFMTEDQVFLPNGARPQPWNTLKDSAGAPTAVAGKIASGQLRMLNRTSKVSHAVAKLRTTMNGINAAGVPLDEIQQADGNVLYDQQKIPVYYDVAMNQTEFTYINNNGLYNANTQAAYASKTNIALPNGSIEVKGAWKVLTATEASSGRFHIAQGYIPGANNGPGQTVAIGLVGFHVFASGGSNGAGMWATFYQVDNAPMQGNIGTGPYSFYNPASQTPINTKNTNPTQVNQVFPDEPDSVKVTKEAQKIIAQGYAQSPWQYYAMVDTQWSPTTFPAPPKPPAAVPLFFGNPSTATMINAVLETFMQTEGNSCLSCHAYATTAQSGSTTAAGFSFMLGNAKAPAKP